MFDMLQAVRKGVDLAQYISEHTFQQRLDLDELVRVVELPEILGLLGKIFPLH